MISELFSRFSGYLMAALLIAAVAAAGYAWIQSARLDASQEAVQRAKGERDAAIAANAALTQQAEKAAAAQRNLQRALEAQRADYERRLHVLHQVADDGCLDRPLPADILRLLTGSDPGAGEAAHPGGP